MKHTFIALTILLATGWIRLCAAELSAKKPNIILIYSDDHGWADLGAQGVDPDIRTPNLDQLAQDGVRFTRGYVSAPQCVPSRAGVITGRYQQRFGVEDNNKGPLPLAELTIAERLKPAGYSSCQIGKWHLEPPPKWKGGGDARGFEPWAQGFDEYYTGAMNSFAASHDAQGRKMPKAPRQLADKRFRCVWQADAAISFIDRHQGDPFFMYLAFFAPHVPLESPEPWFSQTPAHLPKERRQALAMIAAMDDGVGRIRAKLKAAGVEQNTLIFFIGDNGAPLKQGAWNGSINVPLTGEKGMLTDGGIRTPFVAAWPGTLPAGKVYDQPVISLDVAATSVALAGLPPDEKLDGVNLMPYLLGEKTGSPHDALFWRWRSQAAVLADHWKLILLGKDQRYLFDLDSSEAETRNRIAEHPEIEAALLRKLMTWNATLPPPGLPRERVDQDQKFYDDHCPALPAGLPLPPTAGAAGRPNVLFIMSDDLRDTLGCYGHPLAKTPNIDRLAARGVRFDRAYAQYPVCNPSRSSLLTGLRCEETGVTGNGTFFRDLLPEIVTLPQLLRQGGWTTHSFGKIFHTANTGEQQREAWLDVGKSWDKAEAVAPAADKPSGERRNLTGGKLPWCEVGIMDGPEEDQPDAHTASAAIHSLQELGAGGKPWMVAAGFHRPHDPFHAPRKYFDLYPKDKLPLYLDPTDMTPAPPMAISGGWVKVFAGFSDDERRSFLQAYLAGVSFMDAQVGRLIDELDRLHLAENTIIVFLGDNGYHLGERGWWNKNTLFERSCRVPLIIAAPGIRGGQVCLSPVECVDIYPTLADLCDQKPPHTLAGKSLRPLLEDATREHKDAAFTLVARGPKGFGQSVRTPRWRFTRWSDGTMELYDHDADPQETRDLSASPDKTALIAELKAHLDTLPLWPKLQVQP